MSTPRERYEYGAPRKHHLNLLKSNGVTTALMIEPDVVRSTSGEKVDGGYFVVTDDGEDWLAFGTPNDIVYWHPETGNFATEFGKAFAIGEELTTEACTFAFDQSLRIFADLFDWLRHGRQGIVIVNWKHAFDRLRDCPRISIPESLVGEYRQHMRPPRMPKLFVITGKKEAA